MNWRNLFTPVKQMTTPELREYLRQHGSGEYQLLDVRQAKEYEEQHLPGALLIPIRELPGRLGELEASKPLIVYCAVGGRSLAAAQFLAGQGQFELYNLQGGIKAWRGEVATGPEWQGLELLLGAREYRDGYALAYRMEEGLQKLYLQLAAGATGAAAALFRQLAGFEALHLQRLRARPGESQDLPPGDSLPPPLEGGGDFPQVLAAFAAASAPATILELAMGLEAQAQDLYLRLARQQDDRASSALFLALAEEEKKHLAFLAEELDKLASEAR